MTVLVTGARGLLGRLVVEAIASRGEPVLGMGRGNPPPGAAEDWRQADLIGGAGLREAMAGVSSVVHCATDPHRPGNDERMLATLIDAVRPTGAHLVYVGIAGIEDAAGVLPYYRAKLVCEERLSYSGVPHTICRATQFHPFVDQTFGRLGWGPVQLCPAMRLQPVDPYFVADRLAEHSLSKPLGRSADLTGPEVLTTSGLIIPWLRARRLQRLHISIPSIGVLSAWNRLLPATGESGGVAWTQWLNRTALEANR